MTLFDTAVDTAVDAATTDAPGAAHRRGHDTERAAAKAITLRSGSQRTRVLLALADAPAGLTDVELEATLGLQRPSGGNRRGELCQAGLVADSGVRRMTRSHNPAIVWRLTDLGAETAAAVREATA